MPKTDTVKNPEPAKHASGSLPPEPKSKPSAPPPAEPKSMDDYFKPSVGDKPDKAPPPAKPADEPPAENPPAAPPPEDKPAPEPQKPSVTDILDEVTKVTPKPQERVGDQLRVAYEKAKNDFKTYKDTTEARVKQLEERNAKLEESLRSTDYTKSSEYQEQYIKPVEEKYGAAVRLVGRLQADDGARVGKPEDVDELYQLWKRAPSQAIATAKERFGDAGDRVIDAVASIADANERAASAVDTFKNQAAEYSRKREERITQIWQNTVQSAQESRPDLFKFDDDPELAPIAQKTAMAADAAFFGAEGMDEESLVKLRANVRNMAAAFGPIAHDRERLKAKVATLEKQIEEFRASGPKLKAGESAGEGKGQTKVGLEGIEEYFAKKS